MALVPGQGSQGHWQVQLAADSGAALASTKGWLEESLERAGVLGQGLGGLGLHSQSPGKEIGGGREIGVSDG